MSYDPRHLVAWSVLVKIKPLKKDPQLWGRVDDLLDDLATFLKDADETQRRKLKKAHAAHKRGLAASKRMTFSSSGEGVR
jgi:hypothetical protein